MSRSPKFISFLQASGLTLYIILIANFLKNAPDWFKFGGADPVAGIILFLLVFVFSALVSGLLILGYPTMLFFDGKKSLAIRIVFLSGAWLLFFAISFAIFILLK